MPCLRPAARAANERLLILPGVRVRNLASRVLDLAALRRGTDDPWLVTLSARKPPMLAATALANRMARIVWAVSTKKELCRAPAFA